MGRSWFNEHKIHGLVDDLVSRDAIAVMPPFPVVRAGHLESIGKQKIHQLIIVYWGYRSNCLDSPFEAR